MIIFTLCLLWTYSSFKKSWKKKIILEQLRTDIYISKDVWSYIWNVKLKHQKLQSSQINLGRKSDKTLTKTGSFESLIDILPEDLRRSVEQSLLVIYQCAKWPLVPKSGTKTQFYYYLCRHYKSCSCSD